MIKNILGLYFARLKWIPHLTNLEKYYKKKILEINQRGI